MTGVATRAAAVLVATLVVVGTAGCGGGATSSRAPDPTTAHPAHAAGAPSAPATRMPQDVAQGDDDPELTAAIDDADRVAADAEADLADSND